MCKILAGRIYGESAAATYETLCEKLGWARGVLVDGYAVNVDGGRDAWFLAEPFYKRKNGERFLTESKGHILCDGCERMIVTKEAGLAATRKQDKLLFINRNGGYRFMGMYACDKEGAYDIYKRIEYVYEK